MASANSKINIVSLDFDILKQNLQDSLKSQDQFSDWEFTGAGLNVMLDVLSYNSSYLGYYINLAINEAFLETADLRQNIVSHAKEVGYTPQSRTSAKAIVNLVITPPLTPVPPASIIIPKNTKFTTVVDGATFTFVTFDSINVDLDINDTTYKANNVVLYEGLPFSFQYLVNNSLVPKQRFIIPNGNADTKTLTVRVQASTTNTSITVFNLADDINEIDGTTPVYFLQETEDNKFEVYFGDGIIGTAVIDNNLVILDYLASSADSPNQAKTFTSASPINGFSNVKVTTVNAAFGGAERETDEEIKFAAPKNYQAQNRAVTAEDYNILLTRDYPNVDSLSVWGGEDNDPPIYGKVFISLKPKFGFVITQTIKQSLIKEVIKTRSLVTVIPEVIDPDYIYLEIESNVKFNPNLTTLPSNTIQNNVIAAINTFAATEISKFERLFLYTHLTRAIDIVDNSISNNLTNIRMQKRFTPTLNVIGSYTFPYNNSIRPGTLRSTTFISSQDPSFKYNVGDIHGFQDDALGNVQIYKLVGTAKTIVKNSVGTIDYTRGLVTLNTFIPSSVSSPDGVIKMSVIPLVNDVTPVRNNILVVDPLDVIVNMVVNTAVL